ncbi:MAG: GAF domain-containing protein, partial [Nanoarchaeota archaeon]
RILRRRGVQSLLALPVFSEKRWGGAMVLESSKEDYAWGAEDIRMMQTVADMIGAFVASRQTHEELWDKMQMLESFRNATVDQILDMERLEKENAALKKRLEEGGA